MQSLTTRPAPLTRGRRDEGLDETDGEASGAAWCAMRELVVPPPKEHKHVQTNRLWVIGFRRKVEATSVRLLAHCRFTVVVAASGEGAFVPVVLVEGRHPMMPKAASPGMSVSSRVGLL